MEEILVATRRRGERRQIADRRSEGNRRVVGERRLAARRQTVVPVEIDRRSGVDRRARALSTLPVRDHMIIHALRRLIGRLYQISQSRPRAEKITAGLGEARSEILKLDPNLSTIAVTMERLKNTPVAKLEEYKRSQEMLARFNAPGTSPASTVKETHRAPGERKTIRARRTAAGARKSSAKKAARKSIKKPAAKKATNRASGRKTKA